MEVGEKDGGHVAQGEPELPQALRHATAAIKEQGFCACFDQGAWTEPLNARAGSAGTKQDHLEALRPCGKRSKENEEKPNHAVENDRNHIISLSVRVKAELLINGPFYPDKKG
jgi:hypothetical protein